VIPSLLPRLIRGESLTEAEAEAVIGHVMDGGASESQIAALLIALRAKGETVDEIVGAARAMRLHAIAVAPERDDLVDTCGTGGDGLRTFNVSTAAGLVAAGAGAGVAKHGNRAVSSAAGSADVLEALGVAIEIGPVGVARCIAEAGIGFCFAQRFHPAMRFVAPVRRELGVPTIFNFLGPLTNPSRTRHQLVGVNDPTMASIMATVLGATGSRRAMIIHADDGLDELSVTAPSTVLELNGDGAGSFELSEWRIDPASLGFAPATMADLRGGDAAFNARAIRSVLGGAPGANRDIGVLNAAAALMVIGRVDELAAGVDLASAALDDGRAEAALDSLIAASQAAWAESGD
jgi:anthranilate phosphoribosyltransferase